MCRDLRGLKDFQEENPSNPDKKEPGIWGGMPGQAQSGISACFRAGQLPPVPYQYCRESGFRQSLARKVLDSLLITNA
jgi:hypothetical protein